MFQLQNQEIQRCLQHVHPIIQSNMSLHGIYTQVKQFLHRYTLHMSNIVSSKLESYNTPENMMDTFHNINKFTIGYCVLFNKQ